MAGRAGFPDAGGARETFRQMGDRLASMGYVALIPDIYYRAAEWAPFNVATLFTDKQERARLSSLISVLTNDRIIADSGACSGFLLARPEVTGSAIGTTMLTLCHRCSISANPKRGGWSSGFIVVLSDGTDTSGAVVVPGVRVNFCKWSRSLSWCRLVV